MTTHNNQHSPVDQPHDKLVRRLLSNLTAAREILEIYLPEEVKTLLDLQHLERQPDTFVDSRHRFLEVDILFKTRTKQTGKECHIWVLIEQQRQPDVWLPLRQLNYLGIIWDHIRKASKTRSKSARLPFIYPLIISNASSPYRHSLTLRDLIEPEEAKPLFDKLFTTPIQLIDLAAIPDKKLREQLQGHVQAQVLLLSLKHVFDDNLQEYLESVLLSALQTLDKMGYRDEVADLLYYLYNEGNLNNKSQFWMLLDQEFSKNVGEKIMTLGQQDKRAAFEEGMQEGELRGIQATVLRMLEENFDIQIISRITHVSPEAIKYLAEKTNQFVT